ncbi:MAG: hypothetical protein LRY43_03635, partial [Gammaproteobacteria bacterium]|nr:hypothetical protein [Gammaproteobacteria bacterium]
MLTLCVLLGLLFAYFSLFLPSVESLKTANLQSPLAIFSNDGKLIAEFGDIHRIPIMFKDIPKPLLDAVIAT